MTGALLFALLATTGFFRFEADDAGRWNVIDPAGKTNFLRGVDHVRYTGVRVFRSATPFSHYQQWNDAHYPSVDAWADESAARLRDWGFNVIGGGASDEMLTRGFAYYRSLSLSHGLTVGTDNNATGAGKEGLWICPHAGSPMTEFPNVFHPDFPAYCDGVAAELCAPHKDEADLIGYFLDNELAWWGRGSRDFGLYDAAMQLPADHSARQAAEKIGRSDFLRAAAERYFSVVTEAVRRHDPNHLILGTRFAGLEVNAPVVFEIAGQYCDAITFNCYPWADLDRNVVFTKRVGGERIADAFQRVHTLSGKPLIVTEWSFPALDTPCPCLSGGGQRFPTQRERAHASALFARTMLALPYVVGYNYFMWVDEPPEGISAVYPEDSNYGLVNEKGEPYRELTGMFRILHRNLATHRGAPVPAERLMPKEAIVTADAFAAREGWTTAGGFARQGDGWRWENGAGLVLEGGSGAGRPVRQVTLSGRTLGEIGAMVKYATAGGSTWAGVDRVTSFRFRQPAANETSVPALEIVAEGSGTAGVRFGMTLRLSLAATRPEYLLELVSVRNLGSAPLSLEGLYLSPYAPFAREAAPPQPAATPVAPNRWRSACEAAWRATDGRVFGARTEAPYLLNFTFYTDANGVHPDAAFAPPDLPPALRPGAVYVCCGRVWIQGFGSL